LLKKTSRRFSREAFRLIFATGLFAFLALGEKRGTKGTAEGESGDDDKGHVFSFLVSGGVSGGVVDVGRDMEKGKENEEGEDRESGILP
jgi:hypothetical protein